MDEDIEPEVGGRLPKRARAVAIEWLTLNFFRGYNDTGEPELDGAALELGLCLVWIEYREVR